MYSHSAANRAIGARYRDFSELPGSRGIMPRRRRGRQRSESGLALSIQKTKGPGYTPRPSGWSNGRCQTGDRGPRRERPPVGVWRQRSRPHPALPGLVAGRRGSASRRQPIVPAPSLRRSDLRQRPARSQFRPSNSTAGIRQFPKLQGVDRIPLELPSSIVFPRSSVGSGILPDLQRRPGEFAGG